jgi:hypothetical protein
VRSLCLIAFEPLLEHVFRLRSRGDDLGTGCDGTVLGFQVASRGESARAGRLSRSLRSCFD